MSRAYLRKDPGFFERKAIEQDYPAGAYVALDGVLCLAEAQPQRGRFRDGRLLRALLGRYGRWVPMLVEKGDLVELADGRLYVEGWDEWQEGDWKVGERVARIRQRKQGVTPEVTVVTVTSVTPPVVTNPRVRESRSANAEPLTSEEGVQGEKPHRLPTIAVKGMNGAVTEVDVTEVNADLHRLQRLAEEQTGQANVMANVYGGHGKMASDLLERHGFDRVARQFQACTNQVKAAGTSAPTLKQLVFYADDVLNAPPSAKEGNREEAAAEEQARFDRRVANTRARYADRP